MSHNIVITEFFFCFAEVPESANLQIIEEKLRKVLREERDAEMLSISKLTAEKASFLVVCVGIVGTETQPAPDVPPTFCPVIEPFSWAGGEDARNAAAVEVFKHYLEAANVSIASSGIGFKVVDVRRRNILNTQIGRIKLKGRSDAIVIPSAQDLDGLSQQARVVVDFKVSMCSFEAISAQAKGELVAASSLSFHDVMVVFTDLNSFGHILRADGEKLLVWRDLSVRQMLLEVATFLRDECAPVITGGANDARVPGEPDAKRRRFAFVERAHELVPKPTELLEQLEAFNTGHWEDYLEGRELFFSNFSDEQPPSYII